MRRYVASDDADDRRVHEAARLRTGGRIIAPSRDELLALGTWSNSQSRPENEFETERGSYLQRLAGVLRSRHLRWQPAHAALSVSERSIILS